jgi:hypothetical protein
MTIPGKTKEWLRYAATHADRLLKDWQRKKKLANRRQQYRAEARAAWLAEMAAMPRTAVWKKYRRYTYKGIAIKDEGIRIRITFENSRIEDPEFGARAGFVAGQWVAALLLTGGVLTLFVSLQPERIVAWIGNLQLAFLLLGGAAAMWLISLTGSSITGPGYFEVDGGYMRFRELAGGGTGRQQVDRTLFDGASMSQNHESHHEFRARDYYYIWLRYGAVRSAIGVVTSQGMAEQLVLLINEAMQQDLTARPSVDTPVAAPSPPPARGIAIKPDDDL